MNSKEPNQPAAPNGLGPADPNPVGPQHGVNGAGPGPEAPTFVLQSGADYDDGISAADLRRRVQTAIAIIWRYWYTGLIAAVVIGGAFGWFMLRQPVEYQAVTTLLAQSPLEKMIIEANPGTGQDLLQENSLKNHISVMRSRTFLSRYAASFSPKERTAIEAPFADKPEPPTTEGLVAGLVVPERDRGREFFTITSSHPSEDVALLLADRFASEYRALIQDEVMAARRKANLYLRERATELTNEIRSLEDQRREYREKYNLISVEENQGIIADRMRRTNAALAEVKLERLRLESAIARAEQDFKQSPTPFENPVLSVFGNIRDLRLEVDKLRNQRAMLASQFGPNHPTMKEAERNLQGVEELLESAFRLAYEDLKAKLDLTLTSENQYTTEINTLFSRSLELDKMSGGFKRLSDELAAKQSAQADLLQRISRTDVNAQLPVDTLRVVDPAYIAGDSTKRIFLAIAGCIFLAVGAFVAVPIAVYAFTDRVTGSMDVEGEFKLGLLGVIPRLGSTPAGDRPHVVRDNVDLEHVESFMSIAAQLDISSDVAYPKRVLVTSSVPGEGKSMLASNLACTFTRYGRKAILVDFDFRRPTQQDLHDIPDERGFLSWAAADCPMSDDVFVPGGALGITVLPDGTSLVPAGGVHVQPGRFLVAKATIALLEKLSSIYDVVVIDSPPAGLFQDALILARYSHETIVVVREGRPHLTQVKKVLGDLGRMPSRLAGIVLNGFSPRTTHPSLSYRYASYGRYGYGYDGRYRQNEGSKPLKAAAQQTAQPAETATNRS